MWRSSGVRWGSRSEASTDALAVCRQAALCTWVAMAAVGGLGEEPAAAAELAELWW